MPKPDDTYRVTMPLMIEKNLSDGTQKHISTNTQLYVALKYNEIVAVQAAVAEALLSLGFEAAEQMGIPVEVGRRKD